MNSTKENTTSSTKKSSVKIRIMGIANITPDSFSDGGSAWGLDKALGHINSLIESGADIIDIGAESTQPGATPISPEEEYRRLKPVISAYASYFKTPFSIDTKNTLSAKLALDNGASLVNDITALRHDPDMADTVARYNAGVILMHMQGTPVTMQKKPSYTNLLSDIKTFFIDQINLAKEAGIQDIYIDPGIGFGKTVAQNLRLIKHLKQFKSLGHPIAFGSSKKSFIGAITNTSISERLPGTIVSNICAIQNGASLVRVHDVKNIKQAIQILKALSDA